MTIDRRDRDIELEYEAIKNLRYKPIRRRLKEIISKLFRRKNE